MLDLAYKHIDEIRNKMFDTWYDERYKFYHCSAYRNVYNMGQEEGDWNQRQFASLNSAGEVIGLIGYGIDRETETANGFGAINFSNQKAIFGIDLANVIDDVFRKFNMRKLEFSVAVGNPIEKSYDRMIKKYGGHIVGISKRHYRLMDNKFYDEKMYEIFKEDYLVRRYL